MCVNTALNGYSLNYAKKVDKAPDLRYTENSRLNRQAAQKIGGTENEKIHMGKAF